ncbi:response regulator transcription factor [Spirillospora sp. NPDC047279]|uniref:response regulator transcription factor n=1 Tax=Spirillospora sp. NPDC047279 TaxID=3155478 RepID=UPI00340FFE3D
MIEVLIVDGEEAARSGLATALEGDPGIQVTGAARDARTAKSMMRELSPDMMLVDVRLPGAADLLGRGPRVLVLTSPAAAGRVCGSLRRGASGFLFKGSPPDVLNGAIHSIVDGGVVLAPMAARELADAYIRQAGGILDEVHSERLQRLNDKERAVLDLLAAGRSNAEIGGELYMSEGTVKGYVSGLISTFKASNRVQVAVIGYQARLAG